MSWLDRIITFVADRPRRASIQRNKNAGIAKVLLEAKQGPPEQGADHAGMGIVIDPFHVITCAHVVNVALGCEPEASEQPTGKVRVSFPMLGDLSVVDATIVKWRPPGQTPQDDIAVLALDRVVPEEVGVAMLADVTGIPTDGDALSVFGVAEGHRIGNHIDAKFAGSTSAAWVQIDSVDETRPFIEGGFSGAAVWDYPHSAVLGMMVAKSASAKQRVAYIIPTNVVKSFWPDLGVEIRPLGPAFARTWTLLSGIYFVLLLAHWAVNRGVSTFSIITISGNHKQLAAFWGMHIYAVLAVVLLQRLIAFAYSFRLHGWINRVPSFGGLRGKPVWSATWRTAVASLMAFVILPLAAQIHFIRIFHNEGYVYINPSSFAYETDDPVFAGQKCIDLCKKDDAGRYSLAAPKPGHKAAYWSNAYQYGDRDQDSNGSVTFFPILQPVVIILLTVLSAILSALALFAVFRSTPDRAIRHGPSPKADDARSPA